MTSQPDRQFETVSYREDRHRAIWQVVERVNKTISGKQLIVLKSDLSLEDIPEPGKCSSCGESAQKERVSHAIEGNLLIVEAYNMPGYGCTACDLKALDTKSLGGFERVATEHLLEVGDIEVAERYEKKPWRI